MQREIRKNASLYPPAQSQPARVDPLHICSRVDLDSVPETAQNESKGPQLSRVTAVIVNFNSGPWLARCVDSLRAGRDSGDVPPVVIIDNASSDDSLAQLADLAGVRVLRSPRNLGFARGVNAAARAVRTEFLLIINPDCLLDPRALKVLIDDLDGHPEAGLTSGRVFDLHGNEQRGSRRVLPTRRRVVNEVLGRRKTGVDRSHLPAPKSPTEVEAVSGACMLVRRKAFVNIGGFDKAYALHFEDLDFMARLRQAGCKIRLVPEVAITHAGGESSRSLPVQVMWKKHQGLWRYLNQHPETRWPAWNRWLWWLGIHAHAVLIAPVTLWRGR